MKSFRRPQYLRRTAAVLATALAAALLPGAGAAEPAPEAPETPADTVAEEGETEVEPGGVSEETSAAGAGRITILGLTSVNDDTARSWITDQVNFIGIYGVSTARADDTAFFLELAFRSRGFKNARVDWQIAGTPEHITLTVDEGQRLTVGEVAVTGNNQELMPDAAVLELLTSDTREELQLRQDDSVPFVRLDLDGGVTHIREYYHLLSYLDASVELADPDLTATTEANAVPLSLTIREGKPHQVGKVDLGSPPDPELSAEFEAIRTKFEGSKLTPGTLGLVEQALNKTTRDAGYFDRSISVTFDPPVESGDLKVSDIHATADYGPKYTVREVTVTGNDQVDDRVFDKLFGDAAGEVYDPDRFDGRIRKMLATGAFRKIAVEPEPHDDGTLTLDLEVEERKSRRVGVFGGYGTYEGPIIGLDVRDVVLFGRVHQLDLAGEFSARGLRGDFRYTNPWFLWSEWSFGANLFIRTRENEGYDLWESGLVFELRREYGDRHALTFLAGSGYAGTRSAGIDEEFLGPEAYLSNELAVAYDYVQWGRGNAKRRGLKANVVFGAGSVTGDAKAQFARAAGGLTYHLPVKKAEISLGARAGAIAPSEHGDLPIDLRYFNGGSRSVRSFRERDLGPQNNGYPIGGEFYTIFNAEVSYPVWGGFKLALFGDAGNLLSNFEDAGLTEMHYAAGAGLRYDLPIGPLRIDYGHNLNRGDNEPSSSWHLTFGFAF